jgi:hypothetical protein
VRDAVALLFNIPDAGVAGDQARNEILLAVNKALDAKAALPDYDETRRRYQSGQVINATMTVGQWLAPLATSPSAARSRAAASSAQPPNSGSGEPCVAH